MTENSEGTPQTKRSLLQRAIGWALGTALVGGASYAVGTEIPGAITQEKDKADQEAAVTHAELPLRQHLADEKLQPTAGATNTPSVQATATTQSSKD